MNEICASAATLVAAGRSVRCAAADMASGNITLVPTPISANPSSATAAFGANVTISVPTPSTPSKLRAIDSGLWRSTKRSAT